jgi:hypothetical protein
MDKRLCEEFLEEFEKKKKRHMLEKLNGTSTTTEANIVQKNIKLVKNWQPR